MEDEREIEKKKLKIDIRVTEKIYLIMQEMEDNLIESLGWTKKEDSLLRSQLGIKMAIFRNEIVKNVTKEIDDLGG